MRRMEKSGQRLYWPLLQPHIQMGTWSLWVGSCLTEVGACLEETRKRPCPVLHREQFHAGRREQDCVASMLSFLLLLVCELLKLLHHHFELSLFLKNKLEHHHFPRRFMPIVLAQSDRQINIHFFSSQLSVVSARVCARTGHWC